MTTIEMRNELEEKYIETILAGLEEKSQQNIAIAEKYAQILFDALDEEEILLAYSDMNKPATYVIPKEYSETLVMFMMLMTVSPFAVISGIQLHDAVKSISTLAEQVDDKYSAKLYRKISALTFLDIQKIFMDRGVFGKA